MASKVVGVREFDSLIPLLRDRGYDVIGPTVDEGTIVLDHVATSADLPIGWTDHHDKGTYSLDKRADEAYFGYAVGPRTFKRWLYPPRQTILTIEHAETGLVFKPEPTADERYAFVGVRACEIAAMEIQDRVFAHDAFADPHYVERRARSLIVGVNCAVAGETCFCDSMGTGPECTAGYDLVITEVVSGERHEFIVESGTDEGETILTELDGRPTTPADRKEVRTIIEDTAASMTRTMPKDETYSLLTENLEHPIWDSIAERCLNCTNCTLVCPTCFCSTMEDMTDLDGRAVRKRRWDSCFNREFTFLHGHAVRFTTKSRYRQWMTHKLAYWYDQFGTSGCVGCGRCITWCPAKIDITEEIAHLAEQTREEVAT
ncbi:MAG: 4Fe-4S dicluster domain-containing protein [Acidimicrobiia bacterium]|nr:4Fe-4S dicluster domain-containing protein [Acidimicrobiia bacterium]